MRVRSQIALDTSRAEQVDAVGSNRSQRSKSSEPIGLSGEDQCTNIMQSADTPGKTALVGISRLAADGDGCFALTLGAAAWRKIERNGANSASAASVRGEDQ